MSNLLQYSIYFIIYGNIFLLFIKGYFPANETGILFISFLIFMTLAYKFAGSLIDDELNARREEIYNKFETLLEQNYTSISYLKMVYLNIVSQKDGINNKMNSFLVDLEYNLQSNLESGLLNRLQHSSTIRLQTIVRDLLNLQNSTISLAYYLAVKQLLDNKVTNETDNS